MVGVESDAISALTKTMKDIFENQTETIQGLKDAVDKLSKTVDELPKAITEHIDEDYQKDIQEEEAWETVRDTAKDQEKETVESWKDELDNLLVFAGLFSAVVTAFTVESYTWLQQDPEDASNALLSQLSLQLSRLMITFVGNPPSSALVNSTAPALSLPAVEASFSPVPYAVPVNTLWVLSLTLSLISAFFAIAVQQWLRQLRLPPEMPVRRAIQLLATRSDGLRTWQVPSIISLLPLLLQIAVILFLAGLFLLLQSLNATVTIAFGVVALVGLLAFLATTVIPLINPHCPYKSPLVPTAVVALQCLSYPLALMITPVVLVAAVLLASPLGQPIVNCLPGWGYYVDQTVVDFFVDTLVPYVVSFGRHITIDMGRFWSSREHRYIFSRNEDDKIKLEGSSLAQVLLSISSRNSVRVLESLHSVRGDPLLYTIQDTVVQSLRAFRSGLEWLNVIYVNRPDSQMLRYVDGWLSTRQHRLLWQYLHQQDGARSGDAAATDSQVGIVFHELDRALSTTPQRYAKYLLRICADQQFSKSCSVGETIPACLLLDLFSKRGYVSDEDDVATVLAFTAKVYSKYCGRLVDGDRRRLFLVATTLALVVVHKSGTTHSAGMVNTVNLFAGALDEDGTRTAAISELWWYYDHPDSWSRQYLEMMSLANVMRDLCRALLNYASSPLLSTSPEHLRALNRVSATLRTICSDSAYAQKPEMKEARGRLAELDARIRLVPDRNAMVAETVSLAKARLNLGDVSASNNGDYIAATTSSGASPDRMANMSPSSRAAVTTSAAAQTDDLEFVEVLSSGD